MSKDSIEVLLLGAAQDGGCPHCGCSCCNCVAAREDPLLSELPTSIAIISHTDKRYWLIDATPALPEQLERIEQIAPDYTFSGVFLTHAHIGHYAGLMFLGKEVMCTQNTPVYVSSLMGKFLKENAPWSQLIDKHNVVLNFIAEREVIRLTSEVSVEAVCVPHRDEFSDTFAFVLHGPARNLLYCPDIDAWEPWQHDLGVFLADIDYALIDGTFFSDKELPQTRLCNIPHPTVRSSCDKLASLGDRITFIHMNHSNPLYREGMERKQVLGMGFNIGRSGLRWSLSG